MDTKHTVIESPLGRLTAVAEGDRLTGLHFEDRANEDPEAPEAVFGPRVDTDFRETRRQLDEYFAGERTRFDLPLTFHGDDFDKRVWNLIAGIGYGETRSYGHLAEQLGNPGLARAVGAATGRNPLVVVVPCHRVLGADGSLTGFGGGLDRKRYLLRLEEPPAEEAGRLF
ncbi:MULTISPECIES: methylated-DNA--[protein]-cysteine S-methyltransferase [unclassified Actinopolyspora]|uniref:methylated-DNA--[protein]-cysteine S-methyltransferase n=1 Tax=unclassified Actinopolyspora TaxID=2639451 RepID=UPI0013F60793|nr:MULTISPECIES: methylated-DNA--[protein]-cysteine S-methyltransferase [unclassified Actinopolyspora]NHD18406.1 methylated-DNA--[protein]-cysteine S-methyltransferase [Actinopolyspora sp. BKK2]NHE77635.1 methylated-DNA--[protein]-cysteine S-methyltransferase [Actinopolyspora sp. BKK1]